MSKRLSESRVREIRNSWQGNGGGLSLHEITKEYDLTVNEAYSVLSIAEHFTRKKEGVVIHAFREQVA